MQPPSRGYLSPGSEALTDLRLDRQRAGTGECNRTRRGNGNDRTHFERRSAGSGSGGRLARCRAVIIRLSRQRDKCKKANHSGGHEKSGRQFHRGGKTARPPSELFASPGAEPQPQRSVEALGRTRKNKTDLSEADSSTFLLNGLQSD